MKNVSIKGWLLAGLATTLLLGCNDIERIEKGKDASQAVYLAPTTHTCTLEAQARVERETVFCTTNGGYIKAYCYGAAILRNCDKIEPEQPSNDNAATGGTEPRDPGSRMGGTEPRDGGSRMGGEP